MKTGLYAIITKINDEAELEAETRYAQVKTAVDADIEDENALYREEMAKQREVLRKHNEHEYARRLEYHRSRLNRDILVYQRELTDEIFRTAVIKLRDTSGDYFALMFKAALKGLSGRFTLYLGELSQGRLDSRVVAEACVGNDSLTVTLSGETIPRKSGFVLSDGNVEYDHLFEDLAEDMKSTQAAAIMKEVFGNSGDWMFC